MKVVFLLALIASCAFAAPPRRPNRPNRPNLKNFKSDKWKDWQIGGSCTPDNTQVIEAGNAISILLDSFGVQMPAGEMGDGLEVRRTCWLRLAVNPPPGMFLDKFRQTYRGGMVKSANSKARFDVRYQIDADDKERNPLNWRKGQAIDPASPESVFEVTYDDDVRMKKCGRPMKYGISLVFIGQRPSPNEFVIGGLDSIDADWREVKLEAVWSKCPTR